MKDTKFPKTKAPLPKNEKIVGGDNCKKTQAERKRIITKILKED